MDNKILDFNTIEDLRKISPDGEDEFLKEIITLFMNELSVLKEKIGSAFRRREYQCLEQILHNLKGASLNVGAVALGHICKEIENAAKQGQIEIIKKKITDFESISKLTADRLTEVASSLESAEYIADKL
jgi:HPt (histidine-containing phosphotransfer) domain-containing protein